MKIDMLKGYVSMAAWGQVGPTKESICKAINALNSQILSNNVGRCYFLERCPIVGLIVSIPAMLAFGALSTYYFAKSFFAEDDDAKENFENCSKISGLLCLNQLLNICTGGILNNWFAHTLFWTEQPRNKGQTVNDDDSFDIDDIDSGIMVAYPTDLYADLMGVC